MIPHHTCTVITSNSYSTVPATTFWKEFSLIIFCNGMLLYHSLGCALYNTTYINSVLDVATVVVELIINPFGNFFTFTQQLQLDRQ